jgi:hypothetical protein
VDAPEGGGMKFVIRPRRGGKTSELYREVFQNPNGFLVEPTEAIARMTHRQFPTLERRVLSLDQLRDPRLGGQGPIDLYIDNVDMVLQSLIPRYINATIRMVSATGLIVAAPTVDSNSPTRPRTEYVQGFDYL